MNRKEQDKKANYTAENFRTKILVHAISIEQTLTQLIIARFTNDAHHAIKFIEFFEDMSFKRKIELVDLLLASNYPILSKSFKRKELKQLGQIRDIRNRISHHHSSYENNGKETVFVLSPSIVRVKPNKKGQLDRTNIQTFSVRKMNGLIKMAEECDNNMKSMNEKINRFMQKTGRVKDGFEKLNR